MLSYQHIYHAGSWADIHKHAILGAVWAILAKKETPLTYIDGFAARGIFDLKAKEAQKTNEHKTGIGKAGKQLKDLPESFAPWVKAVETYAPHYAGSPAIIAANARKGDKLLLCEKHPQEIQLLKRNTRKLHSAVAIDRDGHEALPKFSPPETGRGLILIDPSYEVKTEYAETAGTVLKILENWPKAPIIIWYPILKGQNYQETLLRGLKKPLENLSFFHAIINNPEGEIERGMEQSGILMINAPFGAKQKAEEITQTLQSIL